MYPRGLKKFYGLQPECRIHPFMFEGRSAGIQPRASKPLVAQFVPPSVADNLCHIPGQGSGFRRTDIEKLSRVDCGSNVRLMPMDRADPGFHLGMPPGLRIDIEER